MNNCFDFSLMCPHTNCLAGKFVSFVINKYIFVSYQVHFDNRSCLFNFCDYNHYKLLTKQQFQNGKIEHNDFYHLNHLIMRTIVCFSFLHRTFLLIPTRQAHLISLSEYANFFICSTFNATSNIAKFSADII